MSPNNIIFI